MEVFVVVVGYCFYYWEIIFVGFIYMLDDDLWIRINFFLNCFSWLCIVQFRVSNNLYMSCIGFILYENIFKICVYIQLLIRNLYKVDFWYKGYVVFF